MVVAHRLCAWRLHELAVPISCSIAQIENEKSLVVSHYPMWTKRCQTAHFHKNVIFAHPHRPRICYIHESFTSMHINPHRLPKHVSWCACASPRPIHTHCLLTPLDSTIFMVAQSSQANDLFVCIICVYIYIYIYMGMQKHILFICIHVI